MRHQRTGYWTLGINFRGWKPGDLGEAAFVNFLPEADKWLFGGVL